MSQQSKVPSLCWWTPRCLLQWAHHPASWTLLRCWWETGLDLAPRSYHSSPSCKLRKPAAAASKTWEQAWVPEPTIRRHPRCREVLEASRVVTGDREYLWQASPDAGKQKHNKTKKFKKVSRWEGLPLNLGRQEISILGFWKTRVWENKGLGDFWLKASLSLQEIHLTDRILQGR